MDSLIKMIAENGILIVIAVVFIWDKVVMSKNLSRMIVEIQVFTKIQADALTGIKLTSDNTATALGIIQNTLAGNNDLLNRHDIRAETINTHIDTALTLLKQRPCTKEKRDPL